jgi:hypothetical protein
MSDWHAHAWIERESGTETFAAAILAVPHEVPGLVVPASPGSMHAMKRRVGAG